MRKDSIKIAQVRYVAPDCKAVTFSPEGVLCGSQRDSYGSPNAPGDDLTFDDYITF